MISEAKQSAAKWSGEGFRSCGWGRGWGECLGGGYFRVECKFVGGRGSAERSEADLGGIVGGGSLQGV